MKIFKRVALVVLALCLLIPFTACQTNEFSGKTLVMVYLNPGKDLGEGEYVPLVDYYADHTRGLDFDILEYFAEQNDMEFKTKGCATREEVIQYIAEHSNDNDKGRLYVGAGGFRTVATGGIETDKVAYSDVYVTADVVALAKKGSGLTKDLSGLKVEAQKVSFGYGYLERGAYGSDIEHFPKGLMSAIQGINEVADGKKDAFICHKNSADVYLADSRYSELEIIEGSEIVEDFVFVVEKDNETIMNFINGCISTWKANENEYNALVEVYMATKNIGTAE